MIQPNYLDIPPRVISALNVGINSIPYRPRCCLPHPSLVPQVPVRGLRGVPPSGPPLPPHPHHPLTQALCTDPAVGPAASYLLAGLFLPLLWCLKNCSLLQHLLCEASPGFFCLFVPWNLPLEPDFWVQILLLSLASSVTPSVLLKLSKTLIPHGEKLWFLLYRVLCK